MAKSSPRVVVDSGVFVNFFTRGATDAPGRFEHSRWVFEAAEQGQHEVVVPAIVIAEVAGAGDIRGSHVSPIDREERCKRVIDWIDASDFLVAEISFDIASHAAELAIEHQLKGADACIVAAALMFGCVKLYSWDDGLVKLDGQLSGLTVMYPAAGPIQARLGDDLD